MKNYFKSLLWLPAFIGFIVYLPSLWFGSSWGDDVFVISPFAKDWNLVLKNFYHNIPSLHFVPFCLLQSFIINVLFGEHAFPFGFHFYHLFLNVITTLLVAVVLYKITKNNLVSILISLIWILHPINVEVLTRLGNAPAQVAAGLFCLIYLLCILKLSDESSNCKKIILLIISITAFLLSLTSYEQYFFVPGLICLVYLIQVFNRNITFSKYCLFYLFPSIIICLLYLAWKYIACSGTLFETSNELIKWTEMGSIRDILFRTVWLLPQLVVHYFRLFFWTDYLAESKADWYIVGESLWSPYSLFCQFFVLFLLISGILLIKRIPLYSLGIFWFFSTMILVLQIIPLFNIIDEHYCYLSVIGIFISIFSVFNQLGFFKNRKVVFSIFIPILLILLWRTELYIPSGKDTLTRHIYMTQEAPDWSKHTWIAKSIDLANIENRENELPAWINEKTFQNEVNKWIDKYLDLKSDYSFRYGPYQMPYNFYVFRGVYKYFWFLKDYQSLNRAISASLRMNDYWLGWYEVSRIINTMDEASWEALKRAIKRNPKMKLSYDEQFIRRAVGAKKIDEAILLIEQYIRYFPRSAFPYLFAGKFYLKIGEKEKALEYFKIAIMPDKYPSINDGKLYNIAAEFFWKEGYEEETINTINIVLSFDPENKIARDELSKINLLRENASSLSN